MPIPAKPSTEAFLRRGLSTAILSSLPQEGHPQTHTERRPSREPTGLPQELVKHGVDAVVVQNFTHVDAQRLRPEHVGWRQGGSGAGGGGGPIRFMIPPRWQRRHTPTRTLLYSRANIRTRYVLAAAHFTQHLPVRIHIF